MNQNAVDPHAAAKAYYVAYGRAMLKASITGTARPVHTPRAASKGENLADPFRADKLLRRF